VPYRLELQEREMRLRLSILTTAVACSLGAGGLEAQQDAAPEERRAHNVYVLKGCLEAAGREAIGEFVLTDAMASGPAPPAAEIESGEPQTTFQLRAVSGITESGANAEELTRHVGFLVEVTVRPPDPVPEPEVLTSANEALPVVTDHLPRIFTVTAVTRQGAECR
jgi:hypothetical protein